MSKPGMGTGRPRGRPRLSPEAKILHGTFNKSRDIPKPNLLPVEEPPKPDNLSAGATIVWDLVMPDLLAAGVISKVDGRAFAAYCEADALWHECEAIMAKEKRFLISCNKIKYAHPALGTMERARRDAMRFASEFGITPASRSRVSVKRKPAEGEAVNPWDELDAGKG